jgi:hypothetical protein
MTTSVSLLMHGDVTAAWKANWAGVIVAALGMATTGWMLALAAGLPSGQFTVDEAVKWLTVAGALTAMARWIIQGLFFLRH